ncbi:MAG: NAD(P)/FAD-dependent oxidoreductase [Thermodesulfobacteriota bacterium]
MIQWVLLAGLCLLFACSPAEVKTASDQAADYDVIVIGAGGGGLGAAARLALAGKKVLVFEQHDKVGGYMTGFSRGDYTFDVSLHAMDGLDPGGLTHGWFQELDIYRRLKPVRLDPMYRAAFPGFALDVPADIEQYRKLLKEKFPLEAAGIDRLFETLDRIELTSSAGLQYMKGNTWGAMWEGLKHPRAIRTMRKYWDVTLTQLLDEFISDQRLRSVFTQLSYFLGDGPDRISALVFAAMWNSYHRHGYYYFEGGSQSVSDALAAVIREHGGEIRLNTLVKKILIEDGRAVGVRTKNNQVWRSRCVISNANAPDTLLKLAGRDHLPEDYAKKVEAMEIAASAFVVYLGVEADYTPEFPARVHELMINISEDPVTNTQGMREGKIEKVPYAITNYSMVDPGAAPAGKNVITLTTVLPYDWLKGWHEDEGHSKYTAFKNFIGEKLIAQAETYLPGLNSRIEVMEVGSPRTMNHYTLNPKGSILGWANTPQQSMLNRLPQETPIENLYLAGAWTFPCGGQSAVIMSGILAADKVLKKM